MSLTNLRSKIKRKSKRIIGRGNGSGHGTYSGRGIKGQNSRTGGKRRPGFEGGQTPYSRKLPKLKGFKNPNKITCQIINTGNLNKFDDNAVVNPETLFSKKLISKKDKPVKLLGGKGELKKILTIEVHKASASAIAIVEKNKGKIKLLESRILKSHTKEEKQSEKTNK